MRMKINNQIYDILKWVAQIVLPALGTLYFGLASIWGFPYGEQIVGTITVIDAFLGAILGISARQYDGDGTLHIDTSGTTKDIYRFELNDDVDKLKDKKNVSFKVNTNAKLK